MTEYKIILAYLADIATAPAILSLALHVGRQQGAHVEALHVQSDPASAIPLVGEGMSATMVEEMLEVAETRAKQRAAELRRRFDAIIADAGVAIVRTPPAPTGLSVAWREESGREEDVLSNLARLSDLVVMARPSSNDDAAVTLSLNAALMESGRPLLLAPQTAPAVVGENIALFWNGSVEAARAVAFSLPFLERARKVTILSAREDGRASPSELAGYLAWRGIATEVKTLASGTPVGQTLLSEAERLNADLVVMGAYTHSRLRQLILGGVTRHVLQAAEIPVLFCH